MMRMFVIFMQQCGPLKTFFLVSKSRVSHQNRIQKWSVRYYSERISRSVDPNPECCFSKAMRSVTALWLSRNALVWIWSITLISVSCFVI